ncbi:hypothetical protein H310_07883 [Aphanomyces invadans]|uniref:Secreted protein n=1 Tax=Aphanomyces invadans TaxID=157072 RepID=A0A024U0R5_9STRA|nr:hypothetical protein H310_07883 [Aphanomyces invadans]ETV99843.1 hypothetical protein H310_07883 [Aphanomyces invadans]|eukprot:XP_008871619.1 hypothetical protein H310_07883 [Aphanomyces invadans]
MGHRMPWFCCTLGLSPRRVGAAAHSLIALQRMEATSEPFQGLCYTMAQLKHEKADCGHGHVVVRTTGSVSRVLVAVLHRRSKRSQVVRMSIRATKLTVLAWHSSDSRPRSLSKTSLHISA